MNIPLLFQLPCLAFAAVFFVAIADMARRDLFNPGWSENGRIVIPAAVIAALVVEVSALAVLL